MNFQEITKELISGRKVRRSCWETGHYWEMKNSQIKNSAGETPTINAHQLEAEDWELYEEEGFCLSERLISGIWDGGYYKERDVKEFIRLLKKTLWISIEDMKFIDKLAGDELKS